MLLPLKLESRIVDLTRRPLPTMARREALARAVSTVTSKTLWCRENGASIGSSRIELNAIRRRTVRSSKPEPRTVPNYFSARRRIPRSMPSM